MIKIEQSKVSDEAAHKVIQRSPFKTQIWLKHGHVAPNFFTKSVKCFALRNTSS